MTKKKKGKLPKWYVAANYAGTRVSLERLTVTQFVLKRNNEALVMRVNKANMRPVFIEISEQEMQLMILDLKDIIAVKDTGIIYVFCEGVQVARFRAEPKKKEELKAE